MQVGGALSTGSLELAKVFDVTMGSLSAGSLQLDYASISVAGKSYLDDGSLSFSTASFASLAANQMVVGIGCRLGVTQFSSNLLAIESGGEFDAAGAAVDVGTLRLASASKVSALAGLTVHVAAQLAPHFLSQADAIRVTHTLPTLPSLPTSHIRHTCVTHTLHTLHTRYLRHIS